MIKAVISWAFVALFITSIIFDWQTALLISVFAIVLIACKAEDDREYERDRERRGIRDDD